MGKEQGLFEAIRQKDAPGVTTTRVIAHWPYSGHPYTVGPEHVAYACDHYGGMLGEATCEAVPCAHPRCTLSYDDHRTEYVQVVRLAADLTAEQWRDWIIDWKPEAEALGLSGVGFEQGNAAIDQINALLDAEQEAHDVQS